jgi:hypothetical protein
MARVLIAVLRSDDAHHLYLERALAGRFEVVLSVVEPATDQRWNLFRLGRYRDFFWWTYHGVRRQLLGLNRYRSRYFADAPPVPPDRQPPVVRTDSINRPAVAAALAAAQPTVTVVIGTSILKPAVLQAAGSTVINIHGGHLPNYRGNWCFFFALYDRRPDLAGTTIHFVDAGIDTGDLIAHVPADARPGETAEELYCRAEKRAIQRLVDLLGDFERGIPLPRRPQPPGGRTFRVRDRKPHHDLIEWGRRRFPRAV